VVVVVVVVVGVVVVVVDVLALVVTDVEPYNDPLLVSEADMLDVVVGVAVWVVVAEVMSVVDGDDVVVAVEEVVGRGGG
jgi:hypothetical protein